MTRKRPLTEEEKLLWKHITRHDKPFKTSADSLEKVEENPSSSKSKKLVGEKPLPIRNDAFPLTPHSLENRGKSKNIGDYAGIDKNTAERFRKGNAAIDATLDLHGMTQKNAHHALISFIGQQVKKESRRLLVITGKGSGILRSSLPYWLSASDLSGYILAFDVAKPKHGGDGAYYILLKRKRV